MAKQNTGQLIEDLHLSGPANARALTAEERADIVEFTGTFEECSQTREELEAMTDSNLVATGYAAMLDYVRGQL